MPNYHAYPQQLASFVDEHWDEDGTCESDLPPFPILETLLSTAYQTSLLREEARQLVFRLILAEPSQFPNAGGPPLGLHKLSFEEPVPFSPHELKPLVHGASFQRSLIGVRTDHEGRLQVWGFINSGPRWLHTQHGGRESAPLLPPSLVINVTGPGCLEVYKGSTIIGQLAQGRVFGPSTNVLQSKWLQELFAQTRSERMTLHQRARELANEPWADLDPEVTHIIDQQMMKRVLAAIKASKHGGTLIMAPADDWQPLLKPYLNVRYSFAEGEPRARFRTLIVSVMNALAATDRKVNPKGALRGWKEYQTSNDATISALDESIFEMSHLIAALSAVDGAVVITRRFELIGFGAEIRCDLAEVKTVSRALDLEGTRYKIEPTRGVGTRHRSAYSLCYFAKNILAIVISQDGGVRFIRSSNADSVMYWDHQANFDLSK